MSTGCLQSTQLDGLSILLSSFLDDWSGSDGCTQLFCTKARFAKKQAGYEKISRHYKDELNVSRLYSWKPSDALLYEGYFRYQFQPDRTSPSPSLALEQNGP